MLQFGAKTFTVDGVTVFADHADREQFWYLPAPVGLARRQADNRAAFTFIKWKPAAVAAGAKGGGFCTFETSLTLPKATEQRIRSRLAAMVRGGIPRLSAVQFDEGTVRCVGLDLEGPGGTLPATPTPAGSFRAIEAIRGATTPSLAGDNTAAFSLTLSQEGAIILEKAFAQGTTPVGVIYDLKFTGLRPALNVKITADYERIFNHFSAGLEAQVYWVRGGIDAGFEKLVADGAIKIEVIDFVGADDKKDKENWALDFFKENLLTKWFEPSLTPADMEARMAKPEGLDAVLKRAAEMLPKPAAQQQRQPQPDPPKTVTERQIAQFSLNRSPEPPPGDHDLSFTPSAAGNAETIKVKGPAGWTARVGGEPARLEGQNILVDITAGESREVVVEWPEVLAETLEETFDLLFEYDKPDVQTGWGVNHPIYKSYIADNPHPSDPEFSGSAAPGRRPPPGGAAALKAWCKRLASPAIVAITGHASFEGDKTAAKRTYNRALSSRRVDVARGIIGSELGLASVSPPPKAMGQDVAEQADRRGDRTDRIARIKGRVAGEAARPGVRLTGRLSRPADVTRTEPGAPAQPPLSQPAPAQPAPSAGGAGMPAVVSFKLKFIHQEERKTMTLTYNRTEAVQRTYAPQGFFGLLLADIADRSKHFVEVDLDDPFFRQFEVAVDVPVDFKKIGLNAVHVGINYGDPGDLRSRKTKDMVFNTSSPQRQIFTTFMSPNLASTYSQKVQFHFEPSGEWQSERHLYEIPEQETIDRTLSVTPFNHIGFLEIEIVPNRIDPKLVERTDVDLIFEDPNGWKATKTIRIKPTSPSQFWRLRTSSRDARSFSYRLTHHLIGRTPIVEEEIRAEAQAIVVDDPFRAALEIEFVPQWDPAAYTLVFVEISYADEANKYLRSERLKFETGDLLPRQLRIPLLDSAKRTFSYRTTFVKRRGRKETAPRETTNTIITLNDDE